MSEGREPPAASPAPTSAEAYLPVAVQRLAARFQPLKIVLFGSRARGDARPDSDIDLLVVLPRVEDYWATVGAMLDVLADRRVPVDVILTDPDEITRRGNLVGTVLRPALREGRVLYEHR